MRVSASIVLYNENKDTLKKSIDSFLALEIEKELIIVDNSPTKELQGFCESFINTKYISIGKNLGFGTAHNLAFDSLTKKSDLHIIINPDVYFAKDIEEYIVWMNSMSDISLSVPKVFFPNGVYQYTVREIPTVITLFKRKIGFRSDEFKENYFKSVTEIPFAHGCFFVFKTDVFEKLSGFDERFFMYMEDVDIFIRAKEFGRTVINPEYKIYHKYRKGSSKNFSLFLSHIKSAFQFFFKYPKQIF